MCGIFAYVGEEQAAPILMEGLSALEYRGYDSAGLCVGGRCVRSVGAVEQLRARLGDTMLAGKSGIAHLRWATHGEPSEQNAHPHADCGQHVFVVHNGIIENFRELREKLAAAGHRFASETDSEVLARLIEAHRRAGADLEQAVCLALKDVRGTYGLAVSCAEEPGTIIAARMGAPIVVGMGERAHFVASDPSPILAHTKHVLYLEDGEVAVLTAKAHRVFSLDGTKVSRDVETIEWGVEQIQKSGFDHFMLKEIMEEPDVIENTIRGRLIPGQGRAKLGGLDSVAERLAKVKRIVVVGCGTAFYAGQVGEYMLEEFAGIPVEVEVGSEFRYRTPILEEGTMLLAISQSGETADTLEAIREAKRQGALTIGIVNTVGSTIARETDAGIYNHAGPEIGVASTKAFISQLTALALLTLFLGRQRTMSEAVGKRIANELLALPLKLEHILLQHDELCALALRYKDARDFLYIGRKYNYATAFEGALKLKEVSYLHAEGCGAGEMKHGPLAMIDKNFPTFAIALQDSVYEKMRSNIQEIKARRGPVVALATEGDTGLADLADDVVFVPPTLEMLSPILAVVPLQLFAYYISVARGLNVDRPRNLAKSVTVE